MYCCRSYQRLATIFTTTRLFPSLSLSRHPGFIAITVAITVFIIASCHLRLYHCISPSPSLTIIAPPSCLSLHLANPIFFTIRIQSIWSLVLRFPPSSNVLHLVCLQHLMSCPAPANQAVLTSVPSLVAAVIWSLNYCNMVFYFCNSYIKANQQYISNRRF